MRKKRIAQTGLCPICHKESESIEHALLFCDWTSPVWFGSQLQIIPERLGTSSLHQWLGNMIDHLAKNPEFLNFGFTAISYTLWHIWKGRNKFVFEGVLPDPMLTIIQVSNAQKEVQGLLTVCSQNTGNQFKTGQTAQIWRNPRKGSIKINSDACFIKNKGISFAGIVGRDYQGKVVTGMAICSPASSPLLAEALALREAVALAANLDLSDVIFESDSLSLIKNCRKESKNGEIITLIQDIEELKKLIPRVGFTWVARKGNYVADLLAHLASTKDLPPGWIWNPPPRLKQALDRDSSCLRQIPIEVSCEVAESSMSIRYSVGEQGDFPLHGGSMHLNPSWDRVFGSLLKPWVQPRMDGVG